MSISGLNHRHIDDAAGRRLELRFPVAAPSLRAATEEALRLARRAMHAADMAGNARSVQLQPEQPLPTASPSG